MNIIQLIQEAIVHPMAVHAYSVGGGNYKVHAVGSKVKYVKAGQTIRSSDLDDLTDAGHKVKEINKPVNEALGTKQNMIAAIKFGPSNISAMRNAEKARTYPKSLTGMGHSSDAHFIQQSQEMQDAINRHLRNGKDYAEAVAAAKVHVKEAYNSGVIGDPKGLIAYVDSLPKDHIDRPDLLTAASHMAFGNMNHLMKHIKALDTDVRGKVNEYMKEEADQTNLGGGKGPIGGKYGMPTGTTNRVTQAMAAAKQKDRDKKITQANRLTKEEADQIDEANYKYSNVNPDPENVKSVLAAHRATGEAARHMGDGKIAYTGTKLTMPVKGPAKVSIKEPIGFTVVDVGPGQKETVRMKEEANQIDEANSHREVDNLKSKGKHHEAGKRAKEAGHPREYGVHFGMRSGIKKAKDDFYQGYDSVNKTKKTNEEAESGLSTKTLAGYSMKASDASKHRKLPTSKVDNRYAGVSKVDRILSARDKKKVD